MVYYYGIGASAAQGARKSRRRYNGGDVLRATMGLRAAAHEIKERKNGSRTGEAEGNRRDGAGFGAARVLVFVAVFHCFFFAPLRRRYSQNRTPLHPKSIIFIEKS